MGVQERFENKKRYQSQYGFDTPTRSGGVADRYEQNKRYASVDTSGVDDEFINRFLKDSNDFVSSAKKDHDSLKWGNAATVHDSRYKSWQDLNGRSETIRAWMHKNRGSIDPDAAKQLGSYLDGFYKNGLSVMGAFGDAKDYYSQWDSEDAYDTYVKFNSVADPDSELYDPDFETKSQYSSTKLDGFWDRFASTYGLGYGDLTYEYINGANNGLRDEIRYNESTFRSDTVGSKNYDQLTNDEIALYNYHYATGGKETAEAYLDSIQEELNRRSAQDIYTNLRGKPTAEMLYGAVVGAEQFGTGIKNLFNFTDKHIPATDTQIAGGMVREDLGTTGPELPKWLGGASLGQVGYDLVNTTANMAPSMVVGSLNPLAGTLTMGASASGNAYQEMLNKGYSKGQSRVYSALVGGSEAGLQYLLGGIGKMGGKVSGNVVGKVLNNVDNAFARTAIKLGGNMLSEGLEEGVQEVLTPWFESITTGEGFELQSEDVLYSSLLGALTAGFLEGGNTISAEVNTYQTGKALQKAGIQASQVEDMSAGLPAGSFARQLASRVDENTGAYTLGRLFNEIGAEITEANQADIQKGLEQRGVRKKDAKTLAASFAAVAAGQSFSETQAAAIEANEDLAKTVVDVITDLKDTVNQRSQGYRDVLMHLTDEMPNTATGSGNAAQEVVAQLAQERTEVSTEDGEAAQGMGAPADTVGAQRREGVSANVMSGRAVDASEGVSEALEEADGTIREVVRQMGGKDAAADVLVDAYHAEGGGDALVYAKGIEEAYTYGKANMPVRELLERGSFAPELTEHQVRTAYRLGQMAGGKLVAKEQAIARRTGGAGVAGKVHFDGDWGKLNEVQTQSLAAMETVADALGVQIHVFESEVDEDGKRTGANGWYDPKDGSFHIDLHAGMDGQGAMLFTLSHELTHFTKQWSPAKYKVLTNFLMEQYGQNDVSVQELVDRQIAKAKRGGRELDFDGALEEVVADSMETMLSDGTVIEKLAQLKQQDRTLWQQLKDWLHEFAEKIRQAYRRLQPDSAEGRLVAQMKDSVERLQELFTEGLVDAGENFGGGAKNTAPEGGAERFSFRTSSSGTANDALLPYSEELFRLIEGNGDVIIDSYEKLVHIVDLAFDEPQKQMTAYFGVLNADTLAEIESKVPNIPKELNGKLFKSGRQYSVAASLDSIRHLVDSKYAMTRQDVLDYLDRIADTIIENDSVNFDYYTDSRNNKLKGLRFKKAFSDGTLVSFEIISNKKMSMNLQTMFMDNASYQKKKSARPPLMQNASAHTPKVRGSQTSATNISQTGPGVNKKITNRDSEGRLLSAQQQEYFKDSKVRDEQGRLMVMYHGTPNGQHTTFRSGSYFTPEKDWADVYQSPSASSISVKRDASHPKTYEVYLDIQKPFDTRNPEERRIFMEEYYRKWGTGAPLADSGLPDWTDGMDLQEFIEEMGYDYDGLILDEGAVGGYGDEVISRGLSYVTFRSDQVKNVDNVSPTRDPDIRYSDRDALGQKAWQALEQENQKLREDASYLKELVKLQRQVTGGTKFTRSSVEAAARILVKDSGAKGDVKELSAMLDRFYGYIASEKELTWEGVMEQAQKPVDWLMEHHVHRKERSEYADDILRQLRGTKVRLDESQMAEAAHRFGSYNDYRKSLFGNVTLSKDGTTSLDELWQELSAAYPAVFDSKTASGDMPGALADIIGRLRDEDISQVEYAENRAFIRQELLRQVYDSYWNVSTLRTVADVKQKQIDRLKGEHIQRMEKLRQSHREKIGQLKQEHRQQLSKVRQEYRDRMDRKVQKTAQRYQEARKERIEGRKRTEVRNKIRSVVKELNQLLLRDDKKRHVPDSMKKAVATALELVNMDTVGAQERIAKYDELISKATDPDIIASLTDTRDRIREQGENIGRRLSELHRAYEEIIDSPDPDIAAGYDPVIAGNLKELSESIGNTSIRDMSIEQLEDVYSMYKMVLTRVRDANKAFFNQKAETISQIAGSVIRQVQAVGGSHKYLPGTGKVNSFFWNNLKPIYAMEKIGSPALKGAFMELIKGEGVYATDVEQAKNAANEAKMRYGYKGWDLKQTYGFQSASGIDFQLTLEQIMSLYAYSRRDQALEHLRLGGFVFDSAITREIVDEDGQKRKKLRKYRVNTAEAHQLTPEVLAKVVGTLTKEQRQFVEQMQAYLSDTMGAKGNEVTMRMYGVKLFKEQHYFPLKSAKQYLFQQNEVAGEVRIKNSGFTQKTRTKANNPVILRGFMDVWAEHVHDMSMYHAFLLPLEDFNRIINYTTPKAEGLAQRSVKETIQNAYGAEAVQYVRQMITDLNGGARSDPRENTAKELNAKFKKAAVVASLSVAIQQPSALMRAKALVGDRYFLSTPKGQLKKRWQEMKVYAPVTVIKEMGRFDTDTSAGTVDYIKDDGGVMKWLDSATGYLPEKADQWTWVQIWEAVKRETAAKHPALVPGSGEHLRTAGERFTEVIVKTQVYDSTLARSSNMRSKSLMMNMATAFMAEPTTSANMVEDAIRQFRRGHHAQAVKTVRAVLDSMIANAVLVSVIYAMRDDDEDETWWEKYASSVAVELVEGANPLTYIPWVKDAWSLAQGYDVARSDMSLIADLVSKVDRWGKTMAADTSQMDEEELAEHQKKQVGAAWGLADGVAAVFGLPLKNARREVEGFINAYRTTQNGQSENARSFWQKVGDAVANATPAVDWFREVDKADRICMAIVDGDTAYAKRAKSWYSSEDAYQKAVRKAVKERVSKGELTDREALKVLTKYCGRSDAQAKADITGWRYQAGHGDEEVSAQWFSVYQEKLADSGIGVDAYVKYRTRRAVYSKKDDVLKVIDGMDLTDAQKDSLYLAEGYAESKLHEAPWN